MTQVFTEPDNPTINQDHPEKEQQITIPQCQRCGGVATRYRLLMLTRKLTCEDGFVCDAFPHCKECS